MSQKKILIVSAFGFLGGDVKMFLLGLPNLGEAGWNLFIATPPYGEVYENFLGLRNARLLLLEMGGNEVVKSSPPKSLIRFVKAIYSLAKEVRKENIDLIYSIDRGVSMPIAFITSIVTGCPLILSAHTSHYLETSILHRKVCNHAISISVLSEDMKKQFRPFVNNPDKLIILKNAIDLSKYEKRYDGQRIRQELRLLPETKVVLLAGRLNPWKGQIELIQAASLVIKEKPDTHFIIAGGEDLAGFQTQLKELIDQLKLGEHVSLVGFRNDLPDILSCADVVTMPSHEEPFGLVALEAMALKKPVVATKAGGVPEFISHGETGMLIPPKNHIALAEALLALLNDPDKARAMGQSAKEFVFENYGEVMYGSRFVSFIERGLSALERVVVEK